MPQTGLEPVTSGLIGDNPLHSVLREIRDKVLEMEILRCVYIPPSPHKWEEEDLIPLYSYECRLGMDNHLLSVSQGKREQVTEIDVLGVSSTYSRAISPC